MNSLFIMKILQIQAKRLCDGSQVQAKCTLTGAIFFTWVTA